MKNRNKNNATREPFVLVDGQLPRIHARYTWGQRVLEFIGFLTSAHPERFHTLVLSLHVRGCQRASTHARKGNGAWFQLSGITLLAGRHYLSGYRNRGIEEYASSIIGNERTSKIIFAYPGRFPDDFIVESKMRHWLWCGEIDAS